MNSRRIFFFDWDGRCPLETARYLTPTAVP